MKKWKISKILIGGFFKLLMGCLLTFHSSIYADARNFVVLTDLEPDDRIALHALAYYLGHDRLGLVGTTLMNSERKRVLTERTVRDLGLLDIPVLRGTGGRKEDYPNIASSAAAREYDQEGQGVLSADELAALTGAPRDGQPFQEAFEAYLRANDNVEVVIMSAPTDIIEVLGRHPELVSKIKTIHVMGGWVADAEGNLRTTFNWNMGHLSSARLLSLSDKVRIRLYSSHLIKGAFKGGTVSRRNMPDLMAALEFARSHLRGLQDLEIASRHWDEGIIERVPKLKDVIGVENIGKQFTPADVALVLALFNEKRLETRTTFAGVSLDADAVDPARGYSLRLDPSARFPVEVVEGLDIDFFEEEMRRIFKYLPNVVESRLREYRFSQPRLNASEMQSRLKDQKRAPVFVTGIGQNINFITHELSKLDPEKHFLVVDAGKKHASEFARLARRNKFRVVGLSSATHLSQVTGFTHYDDFLKARKPGDISSVIYSGGGQRLNLSKPITEEIYISFHTKNQSLVDIERALSALARKHPNATLVHGFLPQSQIHYLPENLQPIVKQTLVLLDRYFPTQVRMRNAYVGLGDTRLEMAVRAARNRSPVYVLGDISGGVAQEVLMYLKSGATPVSLELGETDMTQAKRVSFGHDCLRPLLELAN